MYSVPGDTTSLVPGFPIRTSSDHSSVDSSPRLIAASYVLHRLPVPRHPPCALKHLQTQKPIQKNLKLHIREQQPHHHPLRIPRRKHQRPAAPRPSLARCSQPLSTNQTPHPTTKAGRQPVPQTRMPGRPPKRSTGLLSQSPIVCLAATADPPGRTEKLVVHQNRHPLQARPIQRIAQHTEPPHMWAGHESRGAP